MPRASKSPARRSVRKTEASAAPRLLEMESQEIPEALTAPENPEPMTFRWLWYLLSLGIPFAGVVIGIFLYDHEVRSVRLIGRNSLLIGFVIWVLMPLALVVLLGLLGTIAAMDWLSNVMPPGR